MSSHEYIDPIQADQARLAWDGFMTSRFQSGRGVRLNELDHELKLLEEFSVRAKAQRNAHVGPCKLPNEILCHIFGLLCQTWPPHKTRDAGSTSKSNRYNDGEVAYDHAWIKITHVCSLWRRVALSTPSLWCDVDCANLAPGFRETVLERSVDQPISLRIDYNDCPGHLSAAGWTQLWTERRTCKRLRSLELLNIQPDGGEDLHGILHHLQAMPSLEEINITRLSPYDNDSEPLPIRAHLPEASSIARVCFGDCLPPLSSPIFSRALTHLTLKISDFQTPELVPTPDDMLNLLASLNSLQELQLAQLPVSPPQEPPSEHMDRHTLTLPACFGVLAYRVNDHNGSLASAIEFIPRLRIPRHSAIQIEMIQENENEDEEDDARFVRVVSAVVQSIDMQDCAFALLIDKWDLSIGFGDGELEPLETGSEWPFILIERIEGHGGNVMGVLDVLPLANLTFLTLASWCLDHFFPPGQPSPAALLAARGVRHIAIQVPNKLETSFFEALCQTSADQSAATMLLFPALETITVHWRKAMDKYLTTTNGKPDILQTLFSGIDVALATRELHGTPIREVRVDRRFKTYYSWKVKAPISLFDQDPEALVSRGSANDDGVLIPNSLMI
ncbi:unnamed protein product [Peniophora sp. CBMAI 1063]|nr:unnamed protein product [Peniophora sp. CBMAI 1063]